MLIPTLAHDKVSKPRLPREPREKNKYPVPSYWLVNDRIPQFHDPSKPRGTDITPLKNAQHTTLPHFFGPQKSRPLHHLQLLPLG